MKNNLKNFIRTKKKFTNVQEVDTTTSLITTMFPTSKLFKLKQLGTTNRTIHKMGRSK